MKKFSAIFLLSNLMLLTVIAQDQHAIDSLNTRQIHSMKPEFIMMGMKDAQELANDIEQLSREGNRDLVQEKISLLRKNCEQSLIAL